MLLANPVISYYLQKNKRLLHDSPVKGSFTYKRHFLSQIIEY